MRSTLVFFLALSASGFVPSASPHLRRCTSLATTASLEQALEAMTVKELRTHLKRRGMPTGGRKQDLIDRAVAAAATPRAADTQSVEDEEPRLLKDDDDDDDDELESPPLVVDGLLRDDLRAIGCYAAATKEAARPPKPTVDRLTVGVLVLPPPTSHPVAVERFVDELAFVCNANVVAPIVEKRKTDGDRLAENDAIDWLQRERLCKSLGLVAFGDRLSDRRAAGFSPDPNETSWDAVVAWRPTSSAFLDFVDDDRAAATPVLLLATTADGHLDVADLRRKLDKSRKKKSDYLLRIFDAAEEDEEDESQGGGNDKAPDAEKEKRRFKKNSLLRAFQERSKDEEALLLSTAWLDLHLGREATARTLGPRTSSLWIDDRL